MNKVLQQPNWPNKAIYNKTIKDLSKYPNLVFPKEIIELRQELKEVSRGDKFVIQGGDPNTKDPDLRGQWGMGGPDDLLDAEFNTIKHNRGIVSMARSADPDSAGSQFFIVHKDSSFLDEQYTVFGRIVVEHSFETLDKIANLETDAKDIPLDVEEARINRAVILHVVQVVDLPELEEPERTKSFTSEGGQIVSREGGEQVFTSKQLGIQFEAPEGWLLQHPPKIDHNSPDVVAVGVNTGITPPAISVSIPVSNLFTSDGFKSSAVMPISRAIAETANSSFRVSSRLQSIKIPLVSNPKSIVSSSSR